MRGLTIENAMLRKVTTGHRDYDHSNEKRSEKNVAKEEGNNNKPTRTPPPFIEPL